MFTEDPRPALSDQHIPAVKDMLTSHDIPFTEGGGALRCELKAFGVLYGVVCIISAENLLADKELAIEIQLRRIQSRLYEAELEMTPRPALYLFVVWDAKMDQDRQYLTQRWEIEQHMGVARKVVMQPVEVLDWLQNPFLQREMAARANSVPSLTALRPADFPERQVVPVAELFRPETVFASMAKDNLEPTFAELQPRISHLYRRVMGSVQKVFWTDDGPKLGQVYDEKGLPLDWCSSGERTLFAFCVFLARSASNQTPGLCIGFPATFDGIDELRQITAFDCLRELTAATGISVLMYAPQSDRRARIIMRMRPIVEALGGQVIDRAVDFA